MTSVRDALGEWFALLNRLPPATEIQIAEEAASPGAGATFAAAVIVYPDGRTDVLAFQAGRYDGEPRVFARVFHGSDDVHQQVNAWKEEVSR